MHADLALRMISDLCFTALIVCAPVLGLTMLVGITISIIQVVTQVQEMSLTFVPKLLVAGGTIIFLGPWMMRQIAQYATRLWASIPALF